jgi:hypothetical protein
MPLKTKGPIKLIGNINWCWESGEPVLGVLVARAFLRAKSRISDEIVLAFEDKGYQYNVSLKRTQGARYEGRFDGWRGNEASPVTASCTLYSNDERGYSLIGKWLEDGYEGPWWAELTVVAHFPDELQQK